MTPIYLTLSPWLSMTDNQIPWLSRFSITCTNPVLQRAQLPSLHTTTSALCTLVWSFLWIVTWGSGAEKGIFMWKSKLQALIKLINQVEFLTTLFLNWRQYSTPAALDTVTAQPTAKWHNNILSREQELLKSLTGFEIVKCVSEKQCF